MGRGVFRGGTVQSGRERIARDMSPVKVWQEGCLPVSFKLLATSPPGMARMPGLPASPVSLSPVPVPYLSE